MNAAIAGHHDDESTWRMLVPTRGVGDRLYQHRIRYCPSWTKHRPSTRTDPGCEGHGASSENRTDNTTQQSLEGLIRSSFDLFQLNIPITRLSANVNVFPGITEKDRIRVNTDITLRNEIFRDFFWDLTFYSNYDNQPAEGAEKEDYGIITSLGASF